MFWRRVRSPTAQQQQQDRRGRTGPRALHKILLYHITDLQCKKYVGLKRIVLQCTCTMLCNGGVVAAQEQGGVQLPDD